MTPCIFFAGIGLLMGSFLNVCIVRLPLGESVVAPRSHCRRCGYTVAAWDNVPVLSWLLLRGACRRCKADIGWRYPIVELATSVLFVTSCLVSSSLWQAAAWSLLCFLLLGLAVMDAETLLLPDAFTLPGLVAGLLSAPLLHGPAPLNPMYPMDLPNWTSKAALGAIAGSALAAGIAAGTLLLIAGLYWLVRRRVGMGFGDVKLLAMMGAWLGGPRTALALFLAVVGGAVYGVGLVLLQKRDAIRQGAEAIPAGQIAIPFGTMLCAAGLYCVFLGERTVGWYLRLFP